MRVLFGGVRGSATVAEPGFETYGGHTTAVLCRGADGGAVVLDAGSGLRVVEQALDAEPETGALLMLLTHYHLDHLSGFCAFSRLYRPDATVHLTAPRRGGAGVEPALRGIMTSPFWPLNLEAVSARLRFEDLEVEASAPESPLRFREFEVRWCPLHHPGGCTAYRVDEAGRRGGMVFATDVEWARAGAEEKEALLRLCAEPRPAAMLVFDGQFDDADYARFAGWGHSTWQQAAAVAAEAGVGRLVVTHHAPGNDDRALAGIERRLAERLPGAALARQGQWITLDG